ncbi:hypothetical protein B2J88_38940 [Rhodococcus sp. SRB_17]|nr:hypothetical protein [Rhodococcus sp. SRB_17]
MSTPSKTPPRFVPTLTEVVQWSPALAPDGAEEAPPVPASASGDSPAWASAAAQPVPAAALAPPGLPEDVEELLVHRIMQRVDVMLDQRLRDAIATVVQEQTRSVVPRLREEIESVVRQAVFEAVADELTAGAVVENIKR